MSKLNYINDTIKVKRLNALSKFPTKFNDVENNVGYYIVLTERAEGRSDDVVHDVNMFKTGLVLNPPSGYYLEVVASHDLYTHGYTLIGGSMVLEPNQKGELIVPLYKYKDVPDLELPMRGVQVIVRPLVYARVSSNDRTQTYSDNGKSESSNQETSISQLW